MRIGIFDLSSFFWTLAGARSKDEGAAGLALQVLRYMRERSEKAELDVIVMASDGPPEAPSRSWRLRVDPDYKGHRAPKDEMQRAELVALNDALISAGFPVVSAVEGLVAQDPDGHPERWFEADDIAYSAAKKIASSSTVAMSFEAHVFSNDWDLAQVLSSDPTEVLPSGEAWRRWVRFFTTRGVERAAADVNREFGVWPNKLAELKALAGDVSDGYKPFPGEAPGKPGIGEKGAADILKAFGSAHSAMAAALSDLDSVFAEKGLPKRIPALLRKGGEAALERGLKLATLRDDATVPDDFEVGDWDEAEADLVVRANDQKRVAEKSAAAIPAVDRVQHDGASEGNVAGPARLFVSEDVLPPIEKLVAKTAEKLATEIEAEGRAAREACGTIESLGQVVDEWEAEDEALPPAEKVTQERQAEVLDRALSPKTERVLLTEAEFWAVASLPATWAAGLLDVPPDIAAEIGAFIQAVADGTLRPTVDRRVFIGDLSVEAERGLRLLAEISLNMKSGIGVAEAWREFVMDLESLPRFTALADYGRPLVRAK